MALMDSRDGRGQKKEFFKNFYPVVPQLCQISLSGLQTVQTHCSLSDFGLGFGESPQVMY